MFSLTYSHLKNLNYNLYLSQEKTNNYFFLWQESNGPQNLGLSLHLAYTKMQQSTYIVLKKN